MSVKIVSYNINGIRAAHKKGLLDWVKEHDPDIVALQEVKARPEDVSEELFAPEGYHGYWHSAEKKGYSGVAIWSRQKANHVEVGMGNELYDREGRIIRVDYDQFSLLNVYMPSGSSSEERQSFKDQFLIDFRNYIVELKTRIPQLIVCGDYNIVHEDIDIHNPTANRKSSGFLPHERQWITDFIGMGFTDSFRMLHVDEPDLYTWWSYRAGARQRNKGWRIDYHMVADCLADRCVASNVYREDLHSDHAALELILDL